MYRVWCSIGQLLGWNISFFLYLACQLSMPHVIIQLDLFKTMGKATQVKILSPVGGRDYYYHNILGSWRALSFLPSPCSWNLPPSTCSWWNTRLLPPTARSILAKTFPTCSWTTPGRPANLKRRRRSWGMKTGSKWETICEFKAGQKEQLGLSSASHHRLLTTPLGVISWSLGMLEKASRQNLLCAPMAGCKYTKGFGFLQDFQNSSFLAARFTVVFLLVQSDNTTTAATQGSAELLFFGCLCSLFQMSPSVSFFLVWFFFFLWGGVVRN